jgi:hypothetical protein
METTFAIKNLNSGKLIKNAINLKVMTFTSAEDAQAFANGMAANNRVDNARKGTRIAKFQVVAA